MAEDKKKQNLLSVQLPPLMPLQIYGKHGEDCEPEIPKEVEPCRGEIPFSESPYIPLPPKEELPEIDIQPEEDFCVEIVEAPYLEKPIPGALEIPMEMPLEQAIKSIDIQDIPVLSKPQPTLPNIVNAVVQGLRAWDPSDSLMNTIAGIRPGPATVGQLSQPRPKRKVYSALVERRVFSRQSFPFWVIDFGDQIIATFGYETGSFVAPAGTPAFPPTVTVSALPFTQGASFLTIPTVDPNVVLTPFDGPRQAFTTRLGSQSYAVIRDATIAFDPFCNFTGLPGDNFLALRSYALTVAALKAGQITIASLPFPNVLPITSAIKMVGGSHSFWTSNFGPRFLFNNNQMCVSEINESTHQGPPAPIEIYLPSAGRYAIDIEVPSRPIYPFGAYSAFNSPVAFFWSGTLTLTLEVLTRLGTMAVQEVKEPVLPALPWGRKPWQPLTEPEPIITGLAKKKTTKKKKPAKKKKGRTEPRTGWGLAEPSRPWEPYKGPPYRPPYEPPPYKPPYEPPPYEPPYEPPYSGPPYSGPTRPTSPPPDQPPTPPEGPEAPTFKVTPPTAVRSLRRYLLCWDKEKKKFEKKPLNPGVVCDPGSDHLVSGWAEEGGLF